MQMGWVGDKQSVFLQIRVCFTRDSLTWAGQKLISEEFEHKLTLWKDNIAFRKEGLGVSSTSDQAFQELARRYWNAQILKKWFESNKLSWYLSKIKGGLWSSVDWNVHFF